MQHALNPIEQFLLHLELNERMIFSQHPDYFIYPIVPFFQLVYVCNTEQMIKGLDRFESELGGYLMRSEGYLSFTCPEFNVDEDDLRRLTIQLLEIIRF